MKNHDFVPKLLHNSNISSYFEAQFEDKTHSLTLNFHYKKKKKRLIKHENGYFCPKMLNQFSQ